MITHTYVTHLYYPLSTWRQTVDQNHVIKSSTQDMEKANKRGRNRKNTLVRLCQPAALVMCFIVYLETFVTSRSSTVKQSSMEMKL